MALKTATEMLDELDVRSTRSDENAASNSDQLGGVIFICRCAFAGQKNPALMGPTCRTFFSLAFQ